MINFYCTIGYIGILREEGLIAKAKYPLVALQFKRKNNNYII